MARPAGFEPATNPGPPGVSGGSWSAALSTKSGSMTLREAMNRGQWVYGLVQAAGPVRLLVPGSLRAYDAGVTFTRITVHPDVMAGVPTIRGMRIPVATVVLMVADGLTAEEICRDLPDLEAEDVAEALRYAAVAVRDRDLPLLTA